MEESSLIVGTIMHNFFSSIFSYIIQSFTGPENSENIYAQMLDQAFDRLYRLLSIAAYGLSGVILLLVGVLVTYFSLLAQYDRVGTILLGAVPTGGLVLFFIGLGIIYNASKMQSIQVVEKKHKASPEQQGQTSPLIEQAVALLIMDFIKEREQSREQAAHHQKQEAIVPDEINIH
jgi:hypothetical protein